MKKAMLSQPLRGKTDEEITRTREKGVAHLRKLGYEVVNTLYRSEWYSEENMEKRGVVNKPLCYMAKGMEQMCTCNAVWFAKGWENARGCRIEHEAAEAYGLTILYEEKDD